MESLRFYRDHCKEIRFAGVIVSDPIGHDLKLADLGVTSYRELVEGLYASEEFPAVESQRQ